MIEELVFDDLQPIEIPVKIKHVSGVRLYKLREARGDAVLKYRNAMLRAARVSGESRQVVMEGLADTEPFLVSLCLYNVDAAGAIPLMKDGEPDSRALVPLHEIARLPNEVVKKLYVTVKEISGLNEEADTEETLTQQLTKVQAKLTKLREAAASNGTPPGSSARTVAAKN